ncbi:putative E3 ubiquitin-protein ligase TOM1 [Monocercomonoides exilis]|uniref:putative E3 ubiquitin-protein ligase TOM1 n=1 Tax=Monocercomonoides exilis TaxID=2049356 RepID=UPI0035597E96|nr:putative E3 ubiquitin-protein ligase TOM1 [Monocercomonoides exilis]|eukprot:MONOS_4306.1-p1 / transcript=MONOS_4306.1 / gene=MONOS_4306 / organism=Monocercomonoides_exilis_PA203 / gene_product=Chain A, Structure Of An Rsp5xubxsna3 Complex / transcript_product=Chain A, Structure Of An Rsp5xubxsna3 Complex / location=Mono_scaffold00113:8073-10847(-) / protein_length=804 / sequence_SO=supercontig / SO=protein_coding / is_pseudo=false
MGAEQSASNENLYTSSEAVVWVKSGLKQIPADYIPSFNIMTLDFSGNIITSIPPGLENLSYLTSLILTHNLVSSLPSEIGNFRNLKCLCLAHNKLHSLNSELCNLPNLEYLDVSFNQLEILPENIGKLKTLHSFFCDHNSLYDLPASFSDLQLKKFSIHENYRLCPALQRLYDGEPALFLEHFQNFIKYRRDHPLPSRFKICKNVEKNALFYVDTFEKRTSWIDPRYFLYLRELRIEQRKMFSFVGEPSLLDSVDIVTVERPFELADDHSTLSPVFISPDHFIFPSQSEASSSSQHVKCNNTSSLSSNTQTPSRIAEFLMKEYVASIPSCLPTLPDVLNRLSSSLCRNLRCTNNAAPGCERHQCIRCCLMSYEASAAAMHFTRGSGSGMSYASVATMGCGIHQKLFAQWKQRRKRTEFTLRTTTLWKQLAGMHQPEPEVWRDKPRLKITLRRDRLLQDSFRDVMRADKNRLKLRLNVTYYGESGLDYGGLTREWFQLISVELVKPEYGLFRPMEGNPGVFEINPASGVNPLHLEYFRFVGRVMGKALFDRFLMSAYFSPIVYKALQGKPPCYEDLQLVDPEQYQSLNGILETDGTSIEDLCLTFSETSMTFGEIKEVDLVKDGSSIDVTEENKNAFVQLKALHLVEGRVAPQLEMLRFGFNEIIPQALVKDFSMEEMEKLLCGSVEIDVNDWKKNTMYVNYTEQTPMIVWFWRILEAMDNEQRTSVFQFVTGTTKVPQGGFSNLVGSSGPRRFTINKIPQSPDHLPSAHTCFNQLDLPVYASQDELAEKLMKAVELGLTGFGER